MTMRKTIFAGLVTLAAVWLVAAAFRGQRLPMHAATASVPALGLTVKTELFPLSNLTEFERHMTLATDGATLRVRLPDIRGPADTIGLYRVGTGGTEIAVGVPANSEANGPFFAVSPLRRIDAPSRPPSDWTCLGAFELAMVPNTGDPARGRSQVFTFIHDARADRAAAAPVRNASAGRADEERRADRVCPSLRAPS